MPRRTRTKGARGHEDGSEVKHAVRSVAPPRPGEFHLPAALSYTCTGDERSAEPDGGGQTGSLHKSTLTVARYAGGSPGSLLAYRQLVYLLAGEKRRRSIKELLIHVSLSGSS